MLLRLQSYWLRAPPSKHQFENSFQYGRLLQVEISPTCLKIQTINIWKTWTQGIFILHRIFSSWTCTLYLMKFKIVWKISAWIMLTIPAILITPRQSWQEIYQHQITLLYTWYLYYRFMVQRELKETLKKKDEIQKYARDMFEFKKRCEGCIERTLDSGPLMPINQRSKFSLFFHIIFIPKRMKHQIIILGTLFQVFLNNTASSSNSFS